MWRLIAIVALALSLTVPIGRAEAPPPEKGVSLDFEWLSPPTIVPDSAWGDIVRVNDVMRLSSRPGGTQPTFTWNLRYPISTEEFPMLVLRYRSARIGMATEPLLVVELSQGAVVPVANAGELRQDGTIQELRKDLRPLPPGTTIGRLRFTLPPAVSRFDVVELRFEPASDMPAVKLPVRRSMELAVVDENNRPVSGASVLAGPLERGNWTVQGRTDANGKVSLAVLSPTEGGQAAGMLGLVQPIEAAVMRRGFAPQYFSSIAVRPDEVFAVRLVKAADASAQQPAALPTDNEAVAAQPISPGPVDTGVVQNFYYNYNDQDEEYYDDDYGYRHRYYSPYGYWPNTGYVVVVVKDDKNHDGHGDGDHGQDGTNDNDDGNVDQRTPPIPLPPGTGSQRATPWHPSPSADVTASPRRPMLNVPRFGASTSGNQTWGATSVAGQTVTPVAAYGVTSVPRYRALPVASQLPQVAPSRLPQVASGFAATPVSGTGATTVSGRGPAIAPSQPVAGSPRASAPIRPNVARSSAPVERRSSFRAPSRDGGSGMRSSGDSGTRSSAPRSSAGLSGSSYSRGAMSTQWSPPPLR